MAHAATTESQREDWTGRVLWWRYWGPESGDGGVAFVRLSGLELRMVRGGL